ncbi:MAG: hypothetical protein ACR2GD_04555, partial [Pyrinomonadaceae bacterium]
MNNSDASASQNLIWQVEVGGQIYEANLEELAQWIAEGALQPQDKVRRGNLRWLEANKIPALDGFFNAKEFGLPQPVAITTTEFVQPSENFSGKNETPPAPTLTINKISDQPSFNPPQNAVSPNIQTPTDPSRKFQNSSFISASVCAVHPAEEAHFACAGCAEVFCKLCPKSYGGSVKVCPACGEICQPITEVQKARSEKFQYRQDLNEGFGFADFGGALAFPFKFKFSLVSGALLFMFFTLGENAWAFGGLFLIVAAIFCWMLANTLTFGILANTIENFSHGKIDINFMPSFDDFNLWDDVVQPFFLSIGTYLVSFGLMIAIIAGGIYFARSSMSSETNSGLNQIMKTAAEKNSAPNNLQNSSGALTVEQMQA